MNIPCPDFYTGNNKHSILETVAFITYITLIPIAVTGPVSIPLLSCKIGEYTGYNMPCPHFFRNQSKCIQQSKLEIKCKNDKLERIIEDNGKLYLVRCVDGEPVISLYKK